MKETVMENENQFYKEFNLAGLDRQKQFQNQGFFASI
jgi:hypothetical protein